MAPSNSESTINEQQGSLGLIPEREQLPASGYKSAGGLLHSHLHETIPSSVDKLQNSLPSIFWGASGLSVCGGIVLGIIFIIDLPITVVRQHESLIFVGTVGLGLLAILTGTTKWVISRQSLATQEESVVTLSCLVDHNNTPTIIVDGPNHDKLKSTYEMLNPPCRPQETDQSIATLVDRLPAAPDEEAFQIADFYITEEKETDGYILDKSATLGEADAVHLPLDVIIRRLRNHPSPMVLQFVITPRKIQDDIDERQQDIRHERDYGLVNTVLNAVFDNTDSSETKGRDPDELTGDASRRYHDLAHVAGKKAFGVNLRAITVGSPEAAETAFELVETVIDETLTEFVSLDYTSYTAPTSQETSSIPPWNRKQRVWERVLNQTPRRRDDISLRPGRTPAFFADSETIWNYLLVSTETGDGEQWDHGTDPRDTLPTDTPDSDEYAEYQWDGSFTDKDGRDASESEG